MATTRFEDHDRFFHLAGDVGDRPRYGARLSVPYDIVLDPPAAAEGTRVQSFTDTSGRVTWTAATNRAPMIVWVNGIPVWNFTASSTATDSRYTGSTFPTPVKSLMFILRTTDTTQGAITAAWSGASPYPFDLIRLAGPTSPRWGVNTNGQGLRAPVQAEFFSWHTLTTVLDGASSRIYWDGIDTGSRVTSAASSVTSLNLGGRGTAPLPFQIGGGRLWSGAWTGAQALAMHRELKAAYPQFNLV